MFLTFERNWYSAIDNSHILVSMSQKTMIVGSRLSRWWVCEVHNTQSPRKSVERLCKDEKGPLLWRVCYVQNTQSPRRNAERLCEDDKDACSRQEEAQQRPFTKVTHDQSTLFNSRNHKESFHWLLPAQVLPVTSLPCMRSCLCNRFQLRDIFSNIYPCISKPVPAEMRLFRMLCQKQ